MRTNESGGRLRERLSRLGVALRYVLDRFRHPHARARAVFDLRRRLQTFSEPQSVAPRETELALRLLELRRELSAAFRGVSVCRSCTRPSSRAWPGGQCCGGTTAYLFTDDELAALRLSGTTPGRLLPPDGPMDGCAFRAPSGCSLDPADRPVICVRYACPALERELRQRPDFTRVRALRTEMLKTFNRFVAERARRTDGLPDISE